MRICERGCVQVLVGGGGAQVVCLEKGVRFCHRVGIWQRVSGEKRRTDVVDRQQVGRRKDGMVKKLQKGLLT